MKMSQQSISLGKVELNGICGSGAGYEDFRQRSAFMTRQAIHVHVYLKPPQISTRQDEMNGSGEACLKIRRAEMKGGESDASIW